MLYFKQKEEGGKMIVSRVTRRDRDFMVVCSTYLLNEDYSTVREKITQLAELGQVNAIQLFYLMKAEFEQNKKIDENLKKALQNKNFESDLALRNYLLAKQKSDFCYPNKYLGIEGLEQTSVEQLEKSCFKDLRQRLKEAGCLLLFQRYIDIKALIGKELTQTDKQNLKRTQTKLFKAYKESPRDVETCFLLGKNLACFGESQSYKMLGKQILSDLSKKMISKQLETYPATQTEFIIPEKIVKKKVAKSQKQQKQQRQTECRENEK